jgi:hypothetical protein
MDLNEILYCENSYLFTNFLHWKVILPDAVRKYLILYFEVNISSLGRAKSQTWLIPVGTTREREELSPFSLKRLSNVKFHYKCSFRNTLLA